LNHTTGTVKLEIMVKQIPNILTLGRFVLTVIFLIMVLYSPRFYAEGELPFPDFLDIAFILFVVAGLTDIVDGTIARRLGVTSKFGRMMDPLVDKILVCGAFICFAIIGEPKLFNLNAHILALIQWSVVGILIARDVYVSVLRHIAEARGINFAAMLSGKVKMFLHSFAIGTVIIRMAHVQKAMWGYWFTTVTLLIMLIVTIISGLTYHMRWRACSS